MQQNLFERSRGARISHLALVNPVADQLGEPRPDVPEGTPEFTAQRDHIMRLAFERYVQTGRSFDVDLVPELIGLEGHRIELIDRKGLIHQFVVGRSRGWLPCHVKLAASEDTIGDVVPPPPYQALRRLD